MTHDYVLLDPHDKDCMTCVAQIHSTDVLRPCTWYTTTYIGAYPTPCVLRAAPAVACSSSHLVFPDHGSPDLQII